MAMAADGGRELLPAGAKLEKVASGGRFTEGPAMDAAGNMYYSDNPNNRIMVYTPSGENRVWKEPARSANGMMFDAEGRLITCNAQNAPDGRTVTRYEKNGAVTVLAERYNGKRLNSPNDLCIDRRGRIYFTDPRYGTMDGMEQDRQAVYRLDPDGKLTRVIDDLLVPNGILISPDNRTLYVADNPPSPGPERRTLLIAYDIHPDDRVTRRKVLHDLTPGRGIDGMVMDTDGNLWATAGTGEKSGVYIFSPEGRQLGFIATPEVPGNCTFGDRDLKTLYITASTSLYRIRTNATGLLTYPKPR
jgi:gluconolactonase